MSRYKVEERTRAGHTEVFVVDKFNGEELGHMRVIIGGMLGTYAVPNIGDAGLRATRDPFLVEALGEMFLRSAAILKEDTRTSSSTSS